MKWLYLLCGISRQAHDKAIKRLKRMVDKTTYYLGFIHEVRVHHPGMGLRKMYEQFNPEGIGRDHFISLGLAHGLRLRKAYNPVITTRSVKNNRYSNLMDNKRFTNVNQVWVSDIFYFPLNGANYYVVLIMDAYSRKIVGYNVADNMRAENNIKALKQALILRGIENYNEKLIHHSDRGSQYVSDDYTNLLEEYGIQISMCYSALENAHMERANGTIKNYYLNRWEIKNENQLKQKLIKAIDNYNNRNHDGLEKYENISKITPSDFEIHIKNIAENERPVLKIFTEFKNKNLNLDKNQLSLFKN